MIIDWKKIALNIYNDIKWEISELEKKPTLWAVLVWDNPSSIRYIKQKKKWAEFTWIDFNLVKFGEDVSEEKLFSVNSKSEISY